jgi:hypothetical protein
VYLAADTSADQSMIRCADVFAEAGFMVGGQVADGDIGSSLLHPNIFVSRAPLSYDHEMQVLHMAVFWARVGGIILEADTPSQQKDRLALVPVAAGNDSGPGLWQMGVDKTVALLQANRAVHDPAEVRRGGPSPPPLLSSHLLIPSLQAAPPPFFPFLSSPAPLPGPTRVRVQAAPPSPFFPFLSSPPRE